MRSGLSTLASSEPMRNSPPGIHAIPAGVAAGSFTSNGASTDAVGVADCVSTSDAAGDVAGVAAIPRGADGRTPSTGMNKEAATRLAQPSPTNAHNAAPLTIQSIPSILILDPKPVPLRT